MPSGTDPAAAEDASVTLLAPAKLNLNLRITGLRADGYHLLDSAVVFTAFGDSLVLHERPGATDDRLTVSGPFASAMPHAEADNLCLRAVQAFREAGGICGPLDIHLDKQIPAGAGLGGGSSDAAAILRQLNRASPAPLTGTRLADLALSLGADVPVCLAGGAQRMTGIGERLEAITPLPTGHVVLARPDIMLPTAQVFAGLTPSGAPHPASSHIGGDVRALIAVGNDLSAPAMQLAPPIATLLDAIGDCERCLAAQMSGSGSACFGLFPDQASTQMAAGTLRAAGYWAVATRF